MWYPTLRGTPFGGTPGGTPKRVRWATVNKITRPSVLFYAQPHTAAVWAFGRKGSDSGQTHSNCHIPPLAHFLPHGGEVNDLTLWFHRCKPTVKTTSQVIYFTAVHLGKKICTHLFLYRQSLYTCLLPDKKKKKTKKLFYIMWYIAPLPNTGQCCFPLDTTHTCFFKHHTKTTFHNIILSIQRKKTHKTFKERYSTHKKKKGKVDSAIRLWDAGH